MQGMDSSQNRGELFGPIGLKLPLGQLLGFWPIIDGNKTVFTPAITNASLVQLPG
jgi:hypothetical protein